MAQISGRAAASSLARPAAKPLKPRVAGREPRCPFVVGTAAAVTRATLLLGVPGAG